MINISLIKLHMYCPMKLYLKNNLNEEEKSEYLIYNEIKNLRIDIQDLIQKNMRKLKSTMSLDKIEETLSQNIEKYIESSIESLKNYEYDLTTTKLNDLCKEIKKETNFNLKILSLKVQKAMSLLQKDGSSIVEMFFPNSMYSYIIRDPQLDINGICDKIEIVNGNYYPVNIKSSNPPLKGVWDGDAVELVANALLIEEKFDTEVFVGFVEYIKLGDRRPVVMDASLRKSLFKVLNEIKEITINKKVPKVEINQKKCENCEYEAICINNER